MRLVVLLIVAAAFALRGFELRTPDLGMDGGWSLALSTLSRAEILEISARDVHPPGYYLLLHYWMALAGRSALAAKFLSLFFGVASVAVFYALGKAVASPRAGLVAALLLALSPLHVSSAGLVRDFVASIFFLGVSLYSFLQTSRGARWRAIYVMSTLAAFYTSYFALVVAGIQVLWCAGQGIRALRVCNQGRAEGFVVSASALFDPPKGHGALKCALPTPPLPRGGPPQARGRFDLAGLAGAAVSWLPAGRAFWLLPLGYLPWLLLLAGPAWEKVTGGVTPREATAAPVSPLAYARDLWDLLTVGEFSPLRGTPFALLFAALLLVGLARRRPGRAHAAFLALALAGSAICLYGLVIYWGAEGLAPRYALLLLPLALPLLARSVDALGPLRVVETWQATSLPLRTSADTSLEPRLKPQPPWRHLLGGELLAARLLLLLLVGAATLGLVGYYRRPLLPPSFWDPGGTMRFLSANVAPEDGIIFLTLEQAGYYESQTLQPRPWYYFIIGAEYLRHNLEERANLLLPGVAQRHSRVWLVAYQGGLPGSEPLLSWLNRQWYPAESHWLADSRVIAFLTPREDEVVVRPGAQFGRVGELAEARYNSRSRPGGHANLTLVWRGEGPVEKDYTVFVHLLDDQGQRRAQHDSAPSNGEAPTSRWRPGEEIVDRHGLSLPADLPPGRYTLVVGLYAGEERVELSRGGNSLPVGEVEVGPF